MTNQSVTTKPEQLPFSIDQVQQQAQQIKDLMGAVMKKDTHYGVIPGTKNNSLLKPGADLLLFTFRIALQTQIEDLSTDDCARYRVRAVGVHIGSGVVIGEGVGECSTNEEKFKWRAAVCEEEYNYTPEARRRAVFKTKWANGKPAGNQCIRQVRTEFADKANTVLKIAKKRAQVDLCHTALAVSDVFDRPEVSQQTNNRQYSQPQQQPADKPQTVNSKAIELIRGDQVTFLEQTLESNGVNLQAFLNHFKIQTVSCLPMASMNDAVTWIDGV